MQTDQPTDRPDHQPELSLLQETSRYLAGLAAADPRAARLMLALDATIATLEPGWLAGCTA